MIEWFFDFLYLISKSIFNLIDSLMLCANMLCGIDPIIVDDEEVGFVNYLLYSDRVSLGFRSAALIGLMLVAIFAVIAMVRSVVSEKSGTTPGQVAVKTLKTILLFLCVPAAMLVFVYFTNMFMDALYAATLGGENTLIGNFLCGAFGQGARLGGVPENFYLEEGFDYMSTECVRRYLDMHEFDYFFSWIAGVSILFSLANALLMFVDRAISIVLLYIAAPISMSASVLDDGSHFKLWRDQILVKFLTGYGCILGLNVYMIVISLISTNDVVLIPGSWTLNNVAKIAFIIGGSVSMQRIMALVGNLVSSGAGSNELRDNAIASAGFAAKAGRLFTAPFRAVRGASNFIRDTSNRGFGYALGSRAGFKTDHDYGIKSEKEQANENESKRREHEQLAGLIGDRVGAAIRGDTAPKNGAGGTGSGGSGSGGTGGPQGGDKKKQSPLVNDAITQSINGTGRENKDNNKK